MGFSPCPILTCSTWIVQHFLIFALDNCAFGAFGNKLPGSDLLVPRSVLSLGLQGVEIRLNSASNMSNKSLTWWLSYTILTWLFISTWHMFALVSSCFPLVTSQFWDFLSSQPSLPTSRINLAQALGARHKPPDSAETEMPTACRRAKLRCVRWHGEYLTKGCHKCFQPVILHMASFSEGKSSSGIKALLWPMLYFEDFDTRDITQTTFITFYNHTSWHQSEVGGVGEFCTLAGCQSSMCQCARAYFPILCAAPRRCQPFSGYCLFCLS